MIAVSSVNSKGDISIYSNTGPSIEFSATGENINSTTLKNSYELKSGTSQAAAYVTGFIAILKEKYANLNAFGLRKKMAEYVKDLGVIGKDSNYGYGMIYYDNIDKEPEQEDHISKDNPVEKNSVISSNNFKNNRIGDMWKFNNGDYFEVISNHAIVYDIRGSSGGSYKVIGKLYKGQEFERIGMSADFHKIKFGSYYGYIHKSQTHPSSGSSINNLHSSEKNSGITFKTYQDVKVYDNSTGGAFIPFAEVAQTTEFEVIRGTKNWWKVNYGGRIGYVNKTGTKGEFTRKTKYLRAIVNNAPVYDIRGGYKKVGQLHKGQEYIRIGQSGSFQKIQFGSYAGYVHESQIEPSTGLTLKNKINVEKNSGIQFRTKMKAVVYDNSSGEFIPFGTIDGNTNFEVITGTANWWKINFGGRIGYLSISQTKPIFKSSDKYFKITTNNAIVYDIRSTNGEYKTIGRLIEGQEYKRIGQSASFHKIQFGSYYGYIHTSQTIPITKLSVRNSQRYHTTIGNLTTTKNVTLYDNTNGFVPMLNIKNYQKLPVVNHSGSWYEVNIGGRYGFVHKAAVNADIIKAKNVVNPKTTYTYELLQQDIKELERHYSGIIISKIIGNSVDGRKLYAIKLGKGKTEIFLNGAHHAREWLTTNLLMEMVDTYSQAYANNRRVDGYNARDLLNKVSIWFVPMVNPDGVSLVQKGAFSAQKPAEVVRINNGSTNFKRWKANIRGVDLNRQYPAGWATIKNNRTYPSYMNHKGRFALSEPESRAIYNFTKAHDFKAAVAYHSSGEILYWDYKLRNGTALKYTSRKIANMIRAKTGYFLVFPGPNPSGGGYTDWFILDEKKPGFTPEISPHVGERPVPVSYFNSIWKENYSVGLMLVKEAYENRNSR